MNICIIGAGVAGLQTANILADLGHKCHIFDERDEPGGVWCENYDGYSLQVPSELYEFPGFPTPERDGTFPSGKEVRQYIRDFVVRNDMEGKCTFRLGETVTKLYQINDKKWNLYIKNIYTPECFDFCVIATGMYNNPKVPRELQNLPNIPNLPKVIHTAFFYDAAIVKGKSVVVVGGGKSAIDCAVAASKHTDDVKLLIRELHWPVPRYIMDIIPFKWGTYSRLGHFLLPQHWSISKLTAFFHLVFNPIKYIVWRILEQIFMIQFHLKEKPSIPLEIDVFNGGQILSYEFRDALCKNKIKQELLTDLFLQTKDAHFIICGTGFKKSYDVFDEITQKGLDLHKDGLWLYKNIIPPNVSNLAFIGSEVSTFNNILTHYLQAKWLAYMLTNRGLPSKDNMTAYVDNERKWKRSWMKTTESRASLLQLHMMKYHDILSEDMGETPYKKGGIAEWIVPFNARDYT